MNRLGAILWLEVNWLTVQQEPGQFHNTEKHMHTEIEILEQREAPTIFWY